MIKVIKKEETVPLGTEEMSQGYYIEKHCLKKKERK